MSDTDKREELTTGNMFKLMLKLGIPGIVGMFIISFYNFADAIFVGYFAGSKAVGAIALAYGFTLINNGIAVLIGIGSASILSRAVGRKDKKTIDSVMGNVFLLTFALSSAVTFFGFIFAPQLLRLVAEEGEMLDLGVRYLRIVYLGSVFVNFGQASNMVLRGEGRILLAMIIMASGSVLNIILDAVFIAVLGMGIDGAAIATVISQIVFAVISFIYFLYFEKNLKFNVFKLEFSIIKETFAVGMSAMIMQVMALVQQAVMYSALAKYGGEDQVILMGAAFRYMMLAFIPLWGLSQGFQPFVGTNYGAGLFGRVKKGTLLFYSFGITLALIDWAIFMAVPDKVLGLFIKDNPQLIASGITNARLLFLIFPLVPVLILNMTLFQAVGKAKPAGILALLRQFFLFIPAVLILPIYLGVRGVWSAALFVDSFVIIVSVLFTVRLFTRDLAKEHI